MFVYSEQTFVTRTFLNIKQIKKAIDAESGSKLIVSVHVTTIATMCKHKTPKQVMIVYL